MIFTETYFHLRKKNTQTIILTLKKTSIRDLSTKLGILSYNESLDQDFDGRNIIDQKTGEVILQYDKHNITYLSTDYEIIMECKQFEGTDENLHYVLHNS